MIGTGDTWFPETIRMEEQHATGVLVAWGLRFPPLPAKTEPIPVRFDRLAGVSEKQSSCTLHENERLGRGEHPTWGTDKGGAGWTQPYVFSWGWHGYKLTQLASNVFCLVRMLEDAGGGAGCIVVGKERECKGTMIQICKKPSFFFYFFTVSIFRGKLPWMI